MDVPPPTVLMRSKNTYQLECMAAQAVLNDNNVYKEIRGDHTFYVTQRMETRSSPGNWQCLTTRRIGTQTYSHRTKFSIDTEISNA